MLNNNKKLTVAIPTYNRKEFLNETLESFDSQTFKDFQVIIFDNASDYNVDEFISLFPKLNIKIDKNEKNIGGVANINKIITYDFHSSYVIIFHDDDTLHPEYFEKAINFLDDNPDVVWAGSNINFIDTKNFSKMKYFNSKISQKIFIKLDQRELINKIMYGFNLGFGTIIYKSDILKTIRPRSSEFEKWWDRPFLIDLAANHKIAITDGKFTNYRIHKNKDSLIIKSSNLGYLVNLFNYYKENSNKRNTYRFKVQETNNSINTATQISVNLKELDKNLNILKSEGLFNFKYTGIKGIYYFLRFFIKQIYKIF